MRLTSRSRTCRPAAVNDEGRLLAVALGIELQLAGDGVERALAQRLLEVAGNLTLLAWVAAWSKSWKAA